MMCPGGRRPGAEEPVRKGTTLIPPTRSHGVSEADGTRSRLRADLPLTSPGDSRRRVEDRTHTHTHTRASAGELNTSPEGSA